LKNALKVEGIPGPAAKLYSTLVARSLLARKLYQEIAEEVVLTLPCGRIIDVGTGPGYLPLELARRSEKLEVIGVDVSPAMVKMATKNAEDSNLSARVRFEIGDAANLPFEQGYFDFAVSTFSLHHWSHPVESLQEIHRVLRQGGGVYIYDVKRDMTKKDKKLMRSRYGSIWQFLVSNLVRPHSSMTSKRVTEILSSPEISFSEKRVDNRTGFLKIRLAR